MRADFSDGKGHGKRSVGIRALEYGGAADFVFSLAIALIENTPL